MSSIIDELDRVAAANDFSGVVRVDRPGDQVLRAYGFAHRACGIANTVDTQFAIASGTKGLTALVIVSLIEEGCLAPGTTARSILGEDLPLIGADVTVEHLLGHRSGIGDYLDEDAGLTATDYLMPVPVHQLTTTEDYLRLLAGRATKFAPDTAFSYCNSGYVLLAVIAERAGGAPFDALVRERVCEPAGMTATEFLRSDELPCGAAIGYLDGAGPRTNVFHLPVRGSGDGGIYSTASDVHALWSVLFDGRLVSRSWVDRMTQPRSARADSTKRYGLGFWLDERDARVSLEGYDAGVSFRTVHDPDRQITYTVLSNTTEGAWPVARHLEDALSESRATAPGSGAPAQ